MGSAFMSQQVSSIQDILQQRQQQEFIGREASIKLFRENLFFPPDDDRRRFVLSVSGQGGIGKTSLLNQFIHLATQLGLTAAWTDELQGDVLAVMVHLVEQLDPGHRFFKKFHRQYRAYQRLCQELEADSQAPKGSLAALVRQSLIKVAVRAGHTIPTGGAGLSIVGEDTLAAQIEEGAKYIARKLSNPDSRRLVQEPLAVLTPLFLQGLNRYARGGMWSRLAAKVTRRRNGRGAIALFFDTYERTGDYLDEWLRGILAGRFGEVSPSVVLIISGRDELNRDHWIPYWDCVATLNLEPFSEQEARLYLARKGMVNQPVVDVIVRLSGGLPLLVATLAAERPGEPDQVGDPSGTAVDRFLKWIEDPTRRSAVVQAALPRSLNRDILRELVGEQEVSTFFSWLITRPFVKEQAQAWRYHEVVREQMLRRQRRESPQEWADIHSRLADYYERQWQDADRANGTTLLDPVAQRFFVEACYHRLCQAPRSELKAVLNGFFTLFSLDERCAAVLAEAILQAGKESDETQVVDWGNLLTSGIKAFNEKRYEVTAEVLTKFLESDLLDEQSCAIAYAWRGLVRLELGRYTQAMEDLDASMAASFPSSAHDQPGTSSLSDARELPSSTVGLIVLVVLLLLFLYVWNKNKGITLSYPDMTSPSVEQMNPSDVGTGSPEALIYDEETVALLRQYLKQLKKRKPLDQDEASSGNS